MLGYIIFSQAFLTLLFWSYLKMTKVLFTLLATSFIATAVFAAEATKEATTAATTEEAAAPAAEEAKKPAEEAAKK